MLFEYAVIHHPKKEKSTPKPKDELLIKPTYVLAESDKEVGMLAARAIPESLLGQLDEIEIVIRPFA